MRVDSAADMADIEEMFAAGGALEMKRDKESGIENSEPSPMPSPDAQGHASTLSDDKVIPVVNEEFKVGKRASETRRFVRTYVTERPVQGQVQLEDETMVIERRPISENGAAAPGDLQAREYDVIERHEEPVVDKQARAVEEVVIKKDVKSRTETVSDKLRETEVEVDGQAVPGKIPSQPQ
jgi:stress response protein YsnF